MSTDAYVIDYDSKSYSHLGKLGAGGFSFGSYLRDPYGIKVGSFIGETLGKQNIKIVRSEEIPNDFQEYKDDYEEISEKKRITVGLNEDMAKAIFNALVIAKMESAECNEEVTQDLIKTLAFYFPEVAKEYYNLLD